jgi:LmbE family N-acetylglucosaminyl deacetylase
MAAQMSRSVLHLAPHPDDEAIGAPATLLALAGAGWRVTNLACSLGNEQARERRRGELEASCRLLGFDLVVAPDAVTAGPGSGMAGEDELTGVVMKTIAAMDPQIVVSPSPHDRHPGHEVVARAARNAIRNLSSPARWWMYGIWGDLPLPTLITKFDLPVLEKIVSALSAHAGEVARNDYRVLVENRARANAVTGPERVFGFGSASPGIELVELCTEAGWLDGEWRLGMPQVLDPGEPARPLSTQSVTAWVDAPSVTGLLGRPGSQRI